MKDLVRLLFIMIWIAGIILAKGFVSTLFAVIIPFWALAVVVYNLLIHSGMI